MVTSKYLPSEKVCHKDFNAGKQCLGEKCAAFSFVNYGGYAHSLAEGGCVDYHLPKVIRKLDW